MRLLCFLGFHKRSRGRARDDGHDMVSVCRRCGVPMKRSQTGQWAVVDSEEAH
jgi:hypothetical protein